MHGVHTGETIVLAKAGRPERVTGLTSICCCGGCLICSDCLRGCWPFSPMRKRRWLSVQRLSGSSARSTTRASCRSCSLLSPIYRPCSVLMVLDPLDCYQPCSMCGRLFPGPSRYIRSHARSSGRARAACADHGRLATFGLSLPPTLGGLIKGLAEGSLRSETVPRATGRHARFTARGRCCVSSTTAPFLPDLHQTDGGGASPIRW